VEKNASASSLQAAKDTAFRLLSKRSHTRWELNRKLKQRGFDDADVNEAIRVCRRLGYLDDEALARTWRTQLQERGYGIQRVRLAMRRKGFSRKQIESAFSGYDADTGEVTLAQSVLDRKMRSDTRLSCDRKSRERLYRFLYGRGFSRAVILEVLTRLSNDD
jgi:regulatory protein